MIILSISKLFEYLSILLYFTLLQFYYTKCQCIFVAHFWRNDSKNQNKHKKLRFLSNYKQFKFALNESENKVWHDATKTKITNKY